MTSATLTAPAAVQPFSARRASHLTRVERVANAVFGSPSVRRAGGGAEASFVPYALRSQLWRERRAHTPVFEIDRKGVRSSERLPLIWITEPAYDSRTGAYVGREYVGSYPNEVDSGGWKALELGERYYGEALGCEGAEQNMLRIECFRAAEILFLHAAARGNAEACVKLGIIYLHDFCAGRYWKGLLEHRARHAAQATPEECAFGWFATAAARGNAEACWRMGDMLCESSDGEDTSAAEGKRAYALYRRAYDLAVQGCRSEGAQAGSAALRLAHCHELGLSCEQSFEVARSWYRIAVGFLEEAREEGCWRCKRELARARVGVARMEQEISGRY